MGTRRVKDRGHVAVLITALPIPPKSSSFEAEGLGFVIIDGTILSYILLLCPYLTNHTSIEYSLCTRNDT